MSLTAAQRRSLKARSHSLKHHAPVGKAGLTHAVLQQLRALFQHADLLKVRLPRDLDEFDRVVQSIISEVPCELIERRGRVFTLYRPSERPDCGTG